MQTDAELVAQVVSGVDGAFEELYRRHAQAAWRLAQGVSGSSHDAADAVSEAFVNVLRAVRDGRLHDAGAFRSYLLTATRNAACDGRRRSGRSDPVDDADLDALAGTSPDPTDHVSGHEDARLVAQAFRNLPERWRSVLWLTEVEGMPTKEAASVLGVSANGAAQLAVRARAGLRERYLQAHLRTGPDRGCRFTVDRLGAHVGGGLSAREVAKVDQHLAGCDGCRARREELEEIGTNLRRLVLPIPAVLAASSADRVAVLLHAAGDGSATAAVRGWGAHAAVARRVASAGSPPAWLEKVAAVSSAAVLTAGIISSTIVGNGDTAPAAGAAADRAAAGPPVAPADAGGSAALDTATVAERLGAATLAGRLGTGPAPSDPPAVAADVGPTGGGGAQTDSPQGSTPTSPPPEQPDTVVTDPDPDPVIQASITGRSGTLSGSTSVGVGDGSCTGGGINGSGAGCQEPAPDDDGLTVDTGGQIVPDEEIALP